MKAFEIVVLACSLWATKAAAAALQQVNNWQSNVSGLPSDVSMPA